MNIYVEPIGPGSLVARIIFQPFEEIARVYFSKTLAVCTTEDETEDGALPLQKRSKSSFKENDTRQPSPLSPTQQTALNHASATLRTLLLLEIHLLLILLVFLPPYLPVLLAHFLPEKYLVTSAPSILQAYAYYLPMMSLNGLLEAFAFSVMSPLDVKYQTRWLFLTSVSFAGFVWLFCEKLKQGEVGLVLANVASLGMRAAWAWYFSDRWFKRMWSRGGTGANQAEGEEDKVPAARTTRGIPLQEVLPPFSVLLLFVAASYVVGYSQKRFNIRSDNLLEQRHDRGLLKAQMQHVIVGGGCGLVCLVECYRSQRNHIKTLLSLFRSRGPSS